MTDTVQFSDVQLLNLSTLITIRDGIKRDPVSTCCRFGIGAEESKFLGNLTTENILGIVAHFGQEYLFIPRLDLLSLLQLPLPLTGPVAAARPLRKPTHSKPA